jgi:hypothetical protein
MSLNIDLNAIKNGLEAAYYQVAAVAKKWIGRLVVVIKSGTENALPYLQDKRIAVISLIVTTLLLCEISNVSSRILQRCVPYKKGLQEDILDGVDILVGIAILSIGVAKFAKYTKLPLSPLAIFGVSVGTFIMRVGIFEK